MLRKLLELSRYLLVLPILGALLLTLSAVTTGLGMVIMKEWDLLQTGDFSPKAAKQLTMTVIQSIDMFLVAAICYIMAVGMYGLFVSTTDEPLLKRIKIRKLADLENKIIGVVVVALAVGFLGRAEDAVDAQAVLYGGAGIALVIGALCLFLKFSSSPESRKRIEP